MKALTFDRLGLPADVVSLSEVTRPEPGTGEVLVRLHASPIIPGDALFTQGLYPEPIRPALPGETAGNYGVGWVEQVGAGVGLAPGTPVAVTHKGLWAEYAVAPTRKVVALPPAFPLETGAEFMNLITAWDLLDLSGVRKDQWVVLTAGHASVATLVAQFARAVGVRVLSIVRRRSDAVDLAAFGADAVVALAETDDLTAAVRDVTGGAHGLIDCVGGRNFGDLAAALVFGSRIVVYGGFAPEPVSMHNLDLLLNGLEIRSYVYRYFFDGPGPSDEARVRQVLAMAQVLNVRIPVAGRFRLEDHAAALAETGEPGRRYFRMD